MHYYQESRKKKTFTDIDERVLIICIGNNMAWRAIRGGGGSQGRSQGGWGGVHPLKFSSTHQEKFKNGACTRLDCMKIQLKGQV